MSTNRPPLREIPANVIAVRTGLTAAPRPGPKPRDRTEQRTSYSQPQRRHLSLKSYTREFKLQVIEYCANERIFDDTWARTSHRTRCRAGQGWFDSYHRPPKDDEAAEHFGIHLNNVKRWWRDRERIRRSKKGTRQDHSQVLRSVLKALN